MTDWPAIQSSPSIGSLTYQDEDNVLRTQNDVGPPMKRKRFTAFLRHFSFDIIISKDDVETLDTFYKDTLGMGVGEFNFTDPVSGNTEVFNFDSPPAVASVAAIDYYNVNLKMSRLIS